ncbi:GDT1-like protein 3 [Pistacia vera]|uniref:GDT1-like protein 3 n=1 Tax=Pistacia vera TaxID=55513 RepID=UPI0012630863|nr:GDT1-like protein 3 [Pistacia vera]
MGSCSNPSKRFLFVALFVVLALSPIFAQEAFVDAENDDLSRSVKDLGRRGMIFRNNLDTDIAAIGYHVESGLGVFDAFVASFSMILVSEIGDETFIIAALLAMRHPKSIVLSGALSALIVMTVLSTGLGRIVPNLISRKHTNRAATVLYAFFGMRLLYIAWRSDPKSSQKKEMDETIREIENRENNMCDNKRNGL